MAFKSVVLVDSDPGNSTDVITSLKLANIAVTNATSAEDGFRLLSEVEVGLMLVNVSLGGKRDGGVQLVRRIAADLQKSQTKVAMLVTPHEAPFVEPVRYFIKAQLELPVKFPAFTNEVLELLNSGPAKSGDDSNKETSEPENEVKCCGVDLSSKCNPLTNEDERIKMVLTIQQEVLELIRHSSVFRKASPGEVAKVVSEVTNSVCLRHAKRRSH